MSCSDGSSIFSLPTCGLDLGVFSPLTQMKHYMGTYDNMEGSGPTDFAYDKVISDVLSLIALAAFLMLLKQKTGLPVDLIAPLLMLNNIREWTLLFIAYHLIVK